MSGPGDDAAAPGPVDGPGRLRRQDCYAGAVLATLSVGVIVESWRMPRDLLGWPAYAGPGVVTALLAAGLLGMALALVVRSLRQPGPPLAPSRAEARAWLADPRTARLGLMAALSLGYVLLLGRGLPYSVTTGAYLVVTMLAFRAGRWWAVALIAGAAVTAITLVFNRIFLVPLP